MSIKSPTVFGVCLKLESAYGVDASPTAADYMLLNDKMTVAQEFLNDGNRGVDARSGGNLADVNMSGQSVSTSLKTQIRGAAAPFSSVIVPLELHRLMRINGHAAAFDVAAHKWTYTPVTDDMTSASAIFIGEGENVHATGLLGSSFTIEAAAAGIGTFTTAIKGMGGDPVDAAVPDVSAYDVSTMPWKFDGRGSPLTIGAYSGAVCRSVKFTAEREITARPSGTTVGAHAGFAAGRRKMGVVEIKMEATALSVFNPYELNRLKTVVAFSASAGIAGVSELTVASSYGQVSKVTKSPDGVIAGWTIEISVFGGPDGNSDYRVETVQTA